MQTLPQPLSQLAASLRTLPGVGARSAMRMALHLVTQEHQQHARQLAQDLRHAVDTLRMCTRCRHYATENLCQICQTPNRDNSLLCVVESPTDLIAIESCGGFKGRYFVLHGKLSPIDGVGPEQLGIDMLEAMIRGDTDQHTNHPTTETNHSNNNSDSNTHNTQVREVVLALGTTVEGNVTCHYLQRALAPHGLRISRPAQGIPAGGNVEMLDSITLGQAFLGRVVLDQS